MTTPRIAIGLPGTPGVPEMMRIARRAEDLGYESVWVAETRFTRDAMTTAAAVALATERVGIGTAVVNPVTRGAVLTAISFATLDELSGGRAILGIGPGSPHILGKQGFGFDKPLTRMRECLDVTRMLLRGESVTYHGETISVRDVRLDFWPVRPSMPVYFGVTGPRALELAGETADGVILNGYTSADYARRAVERVKAGAERAGRNPEEVDIASFVAVSMDDDAAKARDAIRPLVATYLANFPNIAREAAVEGGVLGAIRRAFDRGGADAAAEHVADDVLDLLVCAGTPAQCRKRMAERRAAGVSLPIVGLAFGDLDAVLEELSPSAAGLGSLLGSPSATG
ncbi:MAG: LLM class flavin-dependent oxidoreductase [Thermomicrobiales bacterium]|nr:LLM class flavin-dependent oxidoreductase [Thermomicrobiales bacterium]